MIEGASILETIKVNDIVIMRKPHPCGGTEWEVIRYGADVKIQCQTCQRIVMLERPKFMRQVKKVKR